MCMSGDCLVRRSVCRDLKPENILLDYTGSAAMGDFIIKVCDFGLCEKISDEHAVLTGRPAEPMTWPDPVTQPIPGGDGVRKSDGVGSRSGPPDVGSWCLLAAQSSAAAPASWPPRW